MKKLILCIFLGLSCTCTFSQRQRDTQKPNIIIIFMDDMGLTDLETGGAVGYHTPNLNKLALNGQRLTRFYTPQAICSASRAALLTGCYPNRVGIYGALTPKEEIGLDSGETTIAEVLKSVGYATQIVGKWHLGHLPEFLPTRQGFDDFIGLPYSNDMWPIDYDGTPAKPGKAKAKWPVLPLLHISSGGDLPDTVMKIRNMDDQARLTTLYTEESVKFIRNHKHSPFFLYLAHSMPHVPLAVSSRFRGKSELGMYGDVMMEIDWSVGEIMKVLKEEGIDQNTLIIFTSDNGPSLAFGNHGGTTGGLREGKGTSWEGGTRIPCIISWPGEIAKGSINNRLLCTMDILPTLAAITGARLPDHKIDGVNMLSLLRGRDVTPRDTLYYYYKKNDLEAVQIGKWKLVFPHQYRSYEHVLPGKDGIKGEYSLGLLDSLALFDLRRDPGERYNVAQMYPGIISKLQSAAKIAREDLGDHLQNKPGKNRRPVGKR